MLHNKKRRLLMSAGAFIAAAAMTLGVTAAAQAAIPEESGLIITKLEQPDVVGPPATGLPQDTGGTTIPGVTFEGFKVPLSGDPLTNAGREQIAKTTLAEAQALVGNAAAERTGTTDADGEIHWQTGAAAGKHQGDNLEAGLWLIRETATPAGVVAAGDFLVGVPLTHPTTQNSWLDTIYVYPKNHTVEGSKTVENAGQYVVGDTVTWTISVDNPSPRDPITGNHGPAEALTIIDELTEEFLSTNADGSQVNVTGPAGFVKGTDYEVVINSAGGKQTVTVSFTETGLAKLAATPTEKVVMTLDTLIKKEGLIENSARFSTSTSSGDYTEIPSTDMKYGNFALIKKSEGAPAGTTPSLAGAEFMVFTDRETANLALGGDATALGEALKPAVTVPGYDPATGTWTTNADGRVDITGLRYSGYANGESFNDTDPRFVTYWLVETKALKDHQLLVEPISFLVDESSATQTSQAIVNQYDRNGFVLPLTGGTGTFLLTAAGIALLSTVLILARRKRNEGATV